MTEYMYIVHIWKYYLPSYLYKIKGLYTILNYSLISFYLHYTFLCRNILTEENWADDRMYIFISSNKNNMFLGC